MLGTFRHDIDSTGRLCRALSRRLGPTVPRPNATDSQHPLTTPNRNSLTCFGPPYTISQIAHLKARSRLRRALRLFLSRRITTGRQPAGTGAPLAIRLELLRGCSWDGRDGGLQGLFLQALPFPRCKRRYLGFPLPLPRISAPLLQRV